MSRLLPETTTSWQLVGHHAPRFSFFPGLAARHVKFLPSLSSPRSSGGFHQIAQASQTAPVQTPGVQSSASQNELPLLEVGKTIEREMAGGETHSFQVLAQAGQYLRVALDQHGIDVRLDLLEPGGQRLVTMDSLNETQGIEAASLIAEQTGRYRVEVASLVKEAPAGRYEIKLAALREVSEQDRKWIAAQSAYAEGQRLLEAREGAESLLKSVGNYEEAALNWRAAGDRVMELHTLYCIAEAYKFLGRSQTALEYYNQALRLQRSESILREEAVALFDIGLIYNDLGEPRESLARFEQSLSLQRAMRDTYAETRTLGGIGDAYLLTGDAWKALEYYGQALAVWRKMNNRRRMSNTLISVGVAYERLGEYQKAMDHYFQALPLHRALRDRSREASDLNSLGYINGLLGEWKKALEYYDQALALWRATGDREKEANTLGNIGIAHAALNNSQKALEHYQQALTLYRAAGTRRSEAATLGRIGELYSTLADYKQALEYFERSLRLRQATDDRLGEASVLVNIGLVYYRAGAPEKAMEYFNRSLPLSRAAHERRSEALALYGAACVERDRGNLTEARQRIEESLSLIEALRSDIGSEQLRASYLASVRGYYELNLDILMRLHRARPAEGFDALALEASERARARSLLDLLTEARANIRQGADAALLEREQELAQSLNAKANRQMELQGQRGGEAQLQTLNKEISALEDEYQQVRATIRSRSPHYAALTQPQPRSLAEIQQRLLDEDSLLLEYALGEERSYLWAVTKSSIKSYELPKREVIEQAAQRVYDLVTAPSVFKRRELARERRDRLAQAAAQLPAAAEGLSRMILGPAAYDLGERRLVIIADGALQRVPFGMLPLPEMRGQGEGWTGGQGDKETRRQGDKENPQSASQQIGRNPQSAVPLVVRHEIISLPSASTLDVLRKEVTGRRPAPKMLAVIADPVFDQSDARVKAAKPKAVGQSPVARASNSRIIEHTEEPAGGQIMVEGGRLRIPRLPFTQQEAEQILAVAPGAANLKAMSFQANRATALNAELSQYRYVHFATHGYLDSERPGLSAMILSLVNQRGEAEDGFLRAHEIYNLNLPADLVVLSACQTGLGRDFKGEGLVGLTRGFMYAGAARVVVSLWNVNDKATAELMARFYRKMLRDGQRPAEALRAAQVEMWKMKQWSAPYYWAAFTLQGEWK
ncbi:MAG: CHAT domain-containing protein [Blastocatellales bacterium]